MKKIEPVRFEEGREMQLAGLRSHHAFATAERTLPSQWQEFMTWDRIPGATGPYVYGAMCGSTDDGFEYMCGVEVANFDRLPEGMGRMRVPEQRYAVFHHAEHVSSIRSTWEAILEWLQGGDYESANTPDFERYDARFDPMTGSGGVEIWIGVRRRAGG